MWQAVAILVMLAAGFTPRAARPGSDEKARQRTCYRRRFALRSRLLLVLMALGLLAVPASGGDKPAPSKPLLEAEGQLASDDPVDPLRKQAFHKVYSVKLAAGTTYQIDLVSKDFDAYLRLEDRQGKPLAEDDDSGGETNARITYRAAESAAFRVIVTSFGAGATGKFLVKVKPLDQAELDRQKQQREAYALTLEGMRLLQLGKLAEAVERTGQALAMHRALYPRDQYPQGHPDLGLSVQLMGRLHEARAEYGQAEQLGAEALTIWRSAYPKDRFPRGHAFLGMGLTNMGQLYHSRGEYTRAESFMREALTMKQALYPRESHPQGHADLAVGLGNLGAVLQEQGEYGKAEPYLRQSLDMFRALFPRDRYPQGEPQLAISLNNLGGLLHDQGELSRAEPLYREALAMRQALYPRDKSPQGHPLLAASYLSLSTLLDDQLKIAEAVPLVEQAVAMYRTLYPRDRFPRGHPSLALALNNQAHLLQAQRKYGQAEPIFREALQIYEALFPKDQYPLGHPQLANAINNLAHVLHLQAAYAKAEPLYRQALAMKHALYPRDRFPVGHPHLVPGLYNLGALFQEQEKSDQAEPFYRQALEMQTQLSIRFAQVAPEPVALNAAATLPLARDGLLSAAARVNGSDRRTYDAVWQSRAALTRVYQRRHLALIAAATDAAVRKSWDDLQTLRRQREQLIMSPALRATREPKGPDEREQRLAKLDGQIDAAERALLPQLPALKHYEDLDRLGPEALQQRLPAATVLIDLLRYNEYRSGPDTATLRYLAFVVSREAVERVELGPAAKVAEAVRQWRETITARLPDGNPSARKDHEAKLARLGRSLRQLVWEPIEPRLPAGTATIYLAPDAELTQLPWAALPGKGQDRVLLDDYALAVLPHGPFLLEQLTPPPPRPAGRAPAADGLVLVGGIRYDDQPIAKGVAGRGAEDVVGQTGNWQFLHGTDAERRLLANLLESRGPKLAANLHGSEAATARLRQELERCRYAHLATHGFFADTTFRSAAQLDRKLFERTMRASGRITQRIGEGARSPLVLSGLVCAGANRPETPERGILSGDAIAGLLLDDLHLAVLSACDTGLGDVAGGEGVFGLQRAFHIAGGKNVVASLWKVDDAATAALMARFYGHLFADKVPPIEALRRAQLELYRHPELIPAWARGELRAPGQARPANTPAPPETPAELLTSDGRAPIRLWAAFTLSGLGR
jgi:CHAT domain-containing protein